MFYKLVLWKEKDEMKEQRTRQLRNILIKYLSKDQAPSINLPSSSIHFMVKSCSLSKEHMSRTSLHSPSNEMEGSKYVIMMSLSKRKINLRNHTAICSFWSSATTPSIYYQYKTHPCCSSLKKTWSTDSKPLVHKFSSYSKVRLQVIFITNYLTFNFPGTCLRKIKI